MKQYAILKIESFEGQDVFIRCGSTNQDFLFAVIAIDSDGAAEIVDSGYRSLSEAVDAWPEAAMAGGRPDL